MSPLLLYLTLAAGVAALSYWLLVVTEGTYLGPRVVALLYDWTARSYNGIKKLNYVDEARHLGLPLAEHLEALDPASVGCVIDLACGTGRLALTLRLAGGYEGEIIGLDRSPGMLREARKETARARVALTLVAGDVHHLPFADESADAVTCLESIEFFSQPAKMVAECYRVLRPGGLLLTSNRIGGDAHWLPGRHTGRGQQESLLRQVGFQEVDTERWQVHYDLIWALKPAALQPDADRAQDNNLGAMMS